MRNVSSCFVRAVTAGRFIENRTKIQALVSGVKNHSTSRGTARVRSNRSIGGSAEKHWPCYRQRWFSTTCRWKNVGNSESPKNLSDGRASVVPDDPCPKRDCGLSPMSNRSDGSSGGKSTRPESPAAVHGDYAGKARFWRALTIFVALPTVVIATLVVNERAEEERKKPRPEYVPMDYMYRRTKRFPWGDGNHTLFHNPALNPVPPDGYEVDDPNRLEEDNDH